METFTKNPGLQHIAEDIFNILDKKSLIDCRLVNKSWRTIINWPMFWLRKSKSTMPENSKTWKILVDQIEDCQIEEEFVNILIKNFKLTPMSPLEIVVELIENGTYPNVVHLILEHVNPESTVDVEVAPTSTSICPTYRDMTPICLAAFFGLSDSVQKLVKKYGSSNIATSEERTPIHYAARNGYLEIVRFLVPFTKYPNAPDDKGFTPIHYAACCGQLETVHFLTGLTDTPLAPAIFGSTPIHYAACFGHLEVVQFLANFTETPNAPNNFGAVPSSIAKARGHTKVVNFLENYCMN